MILLTEFHKILAGLIQITEEDILRKKCWQIDRGVPVNILE